MDIFAHGLWSAVVYQRAPLRARLWAVFFGVAPDLSSFGVFFIQRLVRGLFFLGKPELLSIPPYVYYLYNLTHRLVVWSVVVVIVYLVRGRRWPWVLGAWGLHIMVDIFTHSDAFFPTPFLWPISSFHVNSFSWAEPWFMALNYSALVVAYSAWFITNRRQTRAVTNSV
jgi:hypothetical protein